MVLYSFASVLPPGFTYLEGELYCDRVSLMNLAQKFGTPLYVYHLNRIRFLAEEYRRAFSATDPLLAYAVKANDLAAILRLLAQLQWGFDIVSLGEYLRVRSAGGDPSRIVFSGVGKNLEEIKTTASEGLLFLNIESENEALRIIELAETLKCRFPVAIRIVPEVEADTHPHIRTGHRGAKFGLPWEEALPLYLKLARSPYIEIRGIATHIGSQILKVEPFLMALERLLNSVDDLKRHGIHLTHLDIGGGVGIPYHPQDPSFPLKEYGERVAELLPRSLKLVLEPGRSVVGDAGVLITEVLYRKPAGEKTLLVVDAAMTELLRPMLYGAYHPIAPLTEGVPTERVDIVGPVCESTDVLALDRELPQLVAGDYLAIFNAGAYGTVMSSNYNSRLRPAEIVVEGDRFAVARPRERYSILFSRDEPYLNWQS